MEPRSGLGRLRGMRTAAGRSRRSPAFVGLQAAVLLSLLIGACTAGAGNPSGGSGAGSAAPPPILYAQDAAAAVAAVNPLLSGIGPKDPNMIGQANWWEATPGEAAKPPVTWTIIYRIGWGDCQAGCIDQHVWTYQVDPDGTVTLLSESGSPLPSDVLAQRAAAATWTGVGGTVTAGPTCPVERPGDPSCEPNPVAGAVLAVTGAGGTEVARVATDAGGLFRIDLQPGDYTLVPQPVEGLLGTAQPMPFTVTQGSAMFLEVSYDTGIR